MIDTKAIRSKILDLAMRGKLTEQLPEDGTAEELYQKIQAEKQKLIKAGKIKKEKALPEITVDEMPFEIPNSWRWARLQDITSNLTLNDGDWVLSDDMDENGTVKLIQLGSIGDLHYNTKGFKYLTTQRFEELNGKQIYPGYLLINRLVADKMLLCIIPEIEGVLITAVDVCWVAPQNEYYDIKFLMYAFASSSMQQKVKEVGYGVTRFRISKTNLISIPFPFPPLAEQHRIVEKIEQAFSVLDTIDALQAKYADNLIVLKSKLIDAAIQGKLTEQLPEDSTAEELYQQIQTEKQALIKSGKIKKEKPLPEIEADEIPFEIPPNWKWVKTGEIFSVGTGLTPLTSERSFYENGHIPWVTSSLTSNRYIQDSATYLSEYALEATSLRLHPEHTLIIAMYGEGKTRGQIAELLIPATTNQACATLDNIIYNQETVDYVFFFFTYNYVQLRSKADGSNQPNLNLNKIKETLIPLPPLAEQKRIVVRLNELLAVCDEMGAASTQRES